MTDTQTMEGIKRNAPEGATHYMPTNDASWIEAYYRLHPLKGWTYFTGNYWDTSDVDEEDGIPLLIDLSDIPDDMAESLPFGLLKGDEDEVNHPSHYQIGAGLQAIDIIKGAMTAEQYKGYLLGNQIKYRMRAGNKGDADKCIAKANWYRDRLNQEFPC